MPTVVKTIGSGGGRDYSTLAAWAAALPADLVADGNIQEGDCYNDSEFSTTGSSLLVLSGHTTDSTHYIFLTTGAGQSFRDNGSVQSNALTYNQANGVGLVCDNHTILIQDDWTVISNLQIKCTDPNTQYPIACLYDNFTMRNCICLSNSVAGGGWFQYNTNVLDPLIENCVFIVDAGGFTPTPTRIIYGYTVRMYSCTLVCVSDKNPAIVAFNLFNSQPSTFENCAIFGVSDMDTGSFSTITYTTCMTDMASPPSGITGSKTYANQFQDTTSAGADFRLKSGADLIDAGTTDSTHGAVDIAKTTRPQGASYDIGAWEFVSAADVLMGRGIICL